MKSWRTGVVPALLLAGCALPPVYTALPVTVQPSPNFGERRPVFVVIHYTSNGSAITALATLTSPFTEVSAHYLITNDGRILYLVDEKRRAWHAGESYWGGHRDLNSSSIGIELDNTGDTPFAEVQIVALLDLLADLKRRWNIPTANFIGHSDIAPGRKTDPGRWFPWRRLALAGFGLWCDPPYAPWSPGDDDALLLAVYGYDTSYLPDAVAAFKIHFAPEDAGAELTAAQRGLLLCLIRRRHGGIVDGNP